VMLRIFVDAGGLPGRIELEASSGYERLDQAALDAVRHWKFVPARRGQEAVSAWVIVPISFFLRGQ
jgi:protein TonB